MAELKPWFGDWQTALKEWNMRESTVIQGWIDQGIEKGIDKGRIQTLRENIRTILMTRFGSVSTELLRRIDESSDHSQLDSAFTRALTVKSPEEHQL